MLRYTLLFRILVLAAVGASSCNTNIKKILDEAPAEKKTPENEATPLPDIKDDIVAGRTYRLVRLDNGLEAFLIHDPATQKSAASMSVAVGSLQNPAEHQGLAHFVEHMMFMGSEKYPEVGAYEKYIASFQGYDNAYTADEETNYFFEVNHDGFLGAIDRFAQMLVAPLFPQEYTERELNAVDAEHQKNLQSDLWRVYRISYLTSRDGHPRQQFFTGDRETLKNANNEVVRDFYNKYYSANMMRLATISSLTLAEQEKQVRASFATLRSTNRDKLTYDADIYAKSQLPLRIEIEPVTDVRKVMLAFAVPSAYNYWQSKPDQLLAALVGDKGKGSLLSMLKARGYATELLSGVRSSSYVGEFEVNITLTARGLAELNEVVSLFFSYIDMLKKVNLQEYYYEESKQLAQIGFNFREPLQGTDAVTYYASAMHRFSALEALKNDRLFFKYEPLDLKIFLNRITPKQLKMIVLAKGVETDKVEPYYGINYSVNTILPQVYEVWERAHKYEKLHYPLPNKFIPTNLDVFADEKRDVPYKLLDTDQGVFWFQQDTTFLRPKARVHLNLLTDKTNTNAKQALMSVLYERSWHESVSEWKYPIMTAGLSFNIKRNNRGIGIDIDGYADKLPLLLSELGKRLQLITIDEVAFAAVKSDLKREIANQAFAVSYRQVIDLGNFILDAHAIDDAAYVELIDDVTLAEVRTYSGELFKELAFEGIAYGNLDSGVLSQQLKAFLHHLGVATLPLARRKSVQNLKLRDKYTYVFMSESNNHALLKLVLAGERSPVLDAKLRVIDTHVGTAFFTELRSKQQLGYVVHASRYYLKKVLGLRFLIQSATYDPQQINERINAFMPMMATQLAELTDAELEAYKQGIVADLQQPETSIAKRHERLEAEAIKLDGDFAYRQKVVAAVQALTKDDIVATWNQAISAGQMNIALFAKDATMKNLPNTTSIIDIAEFKRSRPVYE